MTNMVNLVIGMKNLDKFERFSAFVFFLTAHDTCTLNWRKLLNQNQAMFTISYVHSIVFLEIACIIGGVI